MLYLTYAPAPPLKEFVDYFWLFDGGQTPRRERIVPSGTIELVINLGDDEIRIHDRAQSSTNAFRARFCRELIQASIWKPFGAAQVCGVFAIK